MNVHYTEQPNIQAEKPTESVLQKTTSLDEQEYSLRELMGTLARSKWQIFLIVLASLGTGIAYSLLTEPTYSTNVLLQVERKTKGLDRLENLSTLLRDDTSISAEFEIIRSRMVLGQVVDNLRLDIVAEPVYFPLFGRAVARYFKSPKLINEPWYGLSSYAWGGENIIVDRFDVPDSMLDKEYELVAGKQGQYLLYDPDSNPIFESSVGKKTITTGNDREEIEIFISHIKSRPNTHFTIKRLATVSAIDKLKHILKITELGKNSGILELSYEGSDSEKITKILNEIANIYLRQSVERKSVEAERTLLFLGKQLPKLKDKLENAEAALNNYRLQKGSVDLPMETKGTLEKAVALDAKITELRQNRQELLRRFTTNHPRISALDAQILSLNEELQKVETKVKGLPGTQQEILRLTRNAQVNAELYTSLLNSAQELKVVKAGAVGNVRIIDHAITPIQPIHPNRGVVAALSVILGVILAISYAFFRKTMLGVIHDPELIESKLGLPVLTTIPLSGKQRMLDAKFKELLGGPTVLALAEPGSYAIESIRSLRTALYFTKLGKANRLLSVTSPGAGAGKSFVSVNLAAVLATTGKNVLLIDADLRLGRICKIFDLDNDFGVSQVVGDEIEIDSAIQHSMIDQLDVLPSGVPPSNAADVLSSKRFEDMLKAVSTRYDFVIIDSPPVLAVTDAIIIGQAAAASLLVVRDNHSSLREIHQSIKRLRQANVELVGAVYNGLKITQGHYGYAQYYGYRYSVKNNK